MYNSLHLSSLACVNCGLLGSEHDMSPDPQLMREQITHHSTPFTLSLYTQPPHSHTSPHSLGVMSIWGGKSVTSMLGLLLSDDLRDAICCSLWSSFTCRSLAQLQFLCYFLDTEERVRCCPAGRLNNVHVHVYGKTGRRTWNTQSQDILELRLLPS